MVYKDGLCYEGEWEYGLRHGYGILVDQNG